MSEKQPLLEEVVVRFTFKAEKVNSRRFEEVREEGDEGLMGNVYVPRTTLALIGNPDDFELVIRPITMK